MPYSGPDDDKLPDNVKELDENQRSQWVDVFNSAMSDCEGDDCESQAFAQANGVVFDDSDDNAAKAADSQKAYTGNGAMVSFFVPDDVARQIALPGGEPTNELHMTLCYLGPAITIDNPDLLKGLIQQFAQYHAPILGAIQGVGRFSKIQSDGTTPFYYSVDSPSLPAFRYWLMNYLYYDCGIRYRQEHGFVAHVTGAYIDKDEPLPVQYIEAIPVKFDTLTLSLAGQRFDYSLSGRPEAYDAAGIGYYKGVPELEAKAGRRNAKRDYKMLGDIHARAKEITGLAKGLGYQLEEESDDEDKGDKKKATPETTSEPTEEQPAGNALKALSKTDDELIVGNYIILFDGRDLEGVATDNGNADGSVGEYFTKATQLTSDYTEADVVAVDWEHGMVPEEGMGRDDPLGRVEWKTATVDDKGVFVKRILNRRKKYVQFLEDLIDAGMIGTSSEAIPERVKKAPDGQIEIWPLRRDTLTVAPMEPRMLSQNQLTSLKHLAEYVPGIKQAYKACGVDFPCDDGEGDGGPSRQEAEKTKARLRLKAKLARRQIS